MSGRHFLDQDDDGHWYLIPCERVHEWDNWRESEDSDSSFDDCRIAGAPRWVTFTNPVDTLL